MGNDVIVSKQEWEALLKRRQQQLVFLKEAALKTVETYYSSGAKMPTTLALILTKEHPHIPRSYFEPEWVCRYMSYYSMANNFPIPKSFILVDSLAVDTFTALHSS